MIGSIRALDRNRAKDMIGDGGRPGGIMADHTSANLDVAGRIDIAQRIAVQQMPDIIG